jgi:hypothetical protein
MVRPRRRRVRTGFAGSDGFGSVLQLCRSVGGLGIHMGQVLAFGRSSTLVVALSSALSFGDEALAQAGCGESWVLAAGQSFGSVAICYDEARRETISQFGGKLWAWNGSAWTERWSEPLLDGVDAMAYDRNRQVCWIFGGPGYGERLWKWDGTSLTLISNTTIGGRAYVAMAFDWGRDRLVVHGGQASGQWLYSSWGEWNPDTNQWQVWQNGPIGPRYAHKMVYDPVRQRCVLHGGYYFTNRNDTWTWDGASWTLAGTSGPARYVASMAWDSSRSQVVLHGGTTCCGEVEYQSTWTWRGGSWMQCTLPGPARGYTNMAFDVHRDRFVLPGGFGPTPSGRQWISETHELAMGCVCDIDGDGRVAGPDLAGVLCNWGAVASSSPVDFNKDGRVDGVDLQVVLTAWGNCS